MPTDRRTSILPTTACASCGALSSPVASVRTYTLTLTDLFTPFDRLNALVSCIVLYSAVSIDIPRLSEVLSELVWRIVGGTLPVGVAIDYLASDKPFRKRLGVHEDQGEGSGDNEGGEAGKEKGAAAGGKGERPGGKVEGKEDGAAVEPLVEALCDAVWGVDAMVCDLSAMLQMH